MCKFFYLLGCSFLIFSSSYAQLPAEKRITLTERNVPLRVIFAKITEQTQLCFAGSPNKLNQPDLYSINAQNESISSVLEKLLGPQNINWVLNNNVVSVREERNIIYFQSDALTQ
jgi:hypothetical protein